MKKSNQFRLRTTSAVCYNIQYKQGERYGNKQTIKKYIETNILPKYTYNDKGHNIEHITYVINRSMKFAKQVNNININMVYVIATYHDIGHSINAKEHEKISAQILLKDQEIKKFFTK